MKTNPPGSLEEKVATAQRIVDRLVSIASGFESDEWLDKFIEVQYALTTGRLREAVREESRLTYYSVQPRWVTSRELAKQLEKAMGVLVRQLHWPGHCEPTMVIGELPTDIEERGTIAEEKERSRQQFQKSIIRDPLEENAEFTDVLIAASNRAQAELADHPLMRGLGFCHVHWRRQQEILKEEYGLDWSTPAELNPHISFD